MTFTRNNFPKDKNTSKKNTSKNGNSKNNKKNKKKYISTGNPVGKPTKYRSEMCQKAIELLSNGDSKHAVAAELNISYQTLLDYERKYIEFSNAIQTGLSKSRRWWEDRGKVQCSGKNFDYRVYDLVMRNRFGYNTGNNSKLALEGSLNHNIEGEIEVKSDPRSFTAEVLDILLQSGAIQSEIDKDPDSEDDEIHKTQTDS